MKYTISEDTDRITIINNQFTHTYMILCSFDSDETDKSYIVFSDMQKDEANQINIYAVSIDENTGEALDPNEEDADLINEVMEDVKNEILGLINASGDDVNINMLTKEVEKIFN